MEQALKKTEENQRRCDDEMTARIFERLKEEYESSDHDLGAFIRAIKDFSDSLKRAHGIDSSWIYDAALHHLKAKTKTYIENRKIGLLAALLVGYGCPFNQVKNAMGEWLGPGDTKVKGAYAKICNEFDLPRNQENLSNEKFMEKAELLPYHMAKIIEKPFPKRYEEAYHAFKEAYKASEDAHFYKVIEIFDYKNNPHVTLNDFIERKIDLETVKRSNLF